MWVGVCAFLSSLRTGPTQSSIPFRHFLPFYCVYASVADSQLIGCFWTQVTCECNPVPVLFLFLTSKFLGTPGAVAPKRLPPATVSSGTARCPGPRVRLAMTPAQTCQVDQVQSRGPTRARTLCCAPAAIPCYTGTKDVEQIQCDQLTELIDINRGLQFLRFISEIYTYPRRCPARPPCQAHSTLHPTRCMQ